MVLAHETIYWININADKEMIKNYPVCLDFQVTQPKVKMLSHEIQPDHGMCQLTFFEINNKHCLCMVDYHSKFQMIKQVKGLGADT